LLLHELVLLRDFYTPRKHSLGGYIGIGLSVRLSGPTSTSFVRFPPNFVEFKIMMCDLCSIKDFIVHWVLPLLCLFGLLNFETIQYALCHHKFSYMINQKFMKLYALQNPNMKMCTLVAYPGPLSFIPVMPRTIKSFILQSSHIMILNSTKLGGNRTKNLEVSPDRQTDRIFFLTWTFDLCPWKSIGFQFRLSKEKNCK
jgi:hypothetical protein